MGRKRMPRPKGKQQGKALSPVHREQIRQTFMLTSNKRETARLCAVSEKSVYNVLNEPEEPETVRARQHAALQLSGKVHAKTDQILDHITEADFVSGYLKDEDDNLIFDRQGRPIWMGPTLNQKVLSAAILADKLPVLDNYRKQLDGGGEMGALPTPASIEGLVSVIQGKIKSLKILDVQFENSNPETANRAQELLDKAQRELELDKVVQEARDVTFEELDNPSEEAMPDPPGVQD